MENSIFETKEQYFELVKQWKQSANAEEGPKLTLQHFIVYALLRGCNWRKSLADSSKEETLLNARYWAEDCDPKYLSLWPFGSLITPEMIIKVRAIAAGGE